MTKKVLRVFLTILLTVVFLLVAFFIAVRYPAFQTWLAHRATEILSKSLNSKVSIERVEIQFFNKADLVNVYIEDHEHNPMISAKELRVNFKVFELLSKKIEVSKIFLNEAMIFMHTDTAGNLNLAELVKNYKAKEPVIDTTTSQFTWHIDLHELEMLKTNFRYFDEKAKTDIKVAIPTCNVDVNKLSIDKKTINIKSFTLDGTDVAIDLLKRPKKLDSDSSKPLHFMAGGMVMTLGNFTLSNSHFRMDDHNNDTVLPKGMDFKHLNISNINLVADNGKIYADSLLLNVQKVTAKDRSGFEVLNLATNVRVSNNDITLDKLFLKTPNSEIKKYLSFRFDGFAAFKDFLNQVKIETNLTGSTFSLKDLGYFVRNLDKVEHNKIVLKGEIKGGINSLHGKNIEISSGSSTVFKGDFSASGLPNIYETSLNLRIRRLATTIDDVKKFYPAIKFPQNLNNLGLIYYSGSLDGFLTDFVSKGKLYTSIGSAETDINFKYDKKHNKAAYKGDLALNEFDLGKFFLLEKTMGKVSLQTKITGGGLTLESLHAELNGNISSMSLLGYDYRNVKIDGLVVKKSFSGSLGVHDAYLDMDFNGKANFSDSVPDFNFDADIQKAQLKDLHLTKEDFRLKGKLSTDFRGSKIDNLVGKIHLKDVVVSRDTVDADIKYFDLDAKLLSAEKKDIKINSDFLEGEMTGNFTVKDLPKALTAFAKYTFTKDYVDTVAATEPQDFSLDLRIYEPGNLTRIIHPKFTSIRNSLVTADFNSVDHQVTLTANIPELDFGAYHIKRANVNTHFKNGDFDFRTSIDKVYSGDSLMLDTMEVLAKTQENDDVRFDISLGDKRRFNYANLTAFVTPQKGKAVLRLEPSDIKLGNNYWHFDPGNSVFIEGKKITSNNLVFRTNDQALYISSYLKYDTSTSIKVTLANTDIGDFVGIFATKMKDIHGAVNGKLVVEDVFYKPNIYADLVVDEFKLDKELIGDINIDSRLDSSGTGVLLYASVKSVNNFLEARGNVTFGGNTPSMKIDVDAPRLGLNFLNYKFFTEKYVRDCSGHAIVNATLAGPLSKPLLTGSVVLVDDTVTVSFLNTTYHLKNQKVILDEHGFSFPDLTVYDVRNSLLYASGRINHESFRKFALDLKVRTDGAQFINTTAKQSPNFYGTAFGAGNVVFYGDINSPDIRAYARTLPGTYIRLPVNSTYEVNRYGFYRFIDPKAPQTHVPVAAPQLKLNGVHFVLELEATSDARMDIILDPVAGDVLTTYGSGNLKVEIPRVGNTSIYGSYQIDQGNYLFTLQNVVNKRLRISPGGTINFSGDVYKAGLNVNATYEVRASMYDLIADLLYSQASGLQENPVISASRARVTVRLLLSLTGVLERPNIAFDFEVVDPDPLIKSYVEQKLAILKTNENELNKQVFALLVMNRFFPTSTSTTVSNYVGGTATNTVSEFLSAQLSNYLGNLLDYTGNSTLQNFDINIGYRQYDQSQQTNINNPQTLDTRRELQLALQQRLFNNRLTISAGGNFDFGNAAGDSVARGVIPTGDFQLQYALTRDGRWRAKAFNRTNYDYFNSRNNNRTGIGISYSQEFDKPADLFRKNPKKKKEKKK